MTVASQPHRTPLTTRSIWPLGAGVALLTACAGPVPKAAVQMAPPPSVYVPPPPAAVVAAPVAAPRPARADPILVARIAELGRGFPGHAGIAVRDVHEGWTASHNGSALFPQQSVSKLWVAIALMDRIDQGAVRLSDPITVGPSDMTVFHQPIRASLRGGYLTTTVGDLLNRAMTQSDNTANDKLLNLVGGPAAVRAVLSRGKVVNVRFGPGERLLQSGTAGLTWQPGYSVGNAFYAARSALPASVRESAFARYLADPVDGASPDGITDGLAKLKRGELVTPRSAQELISVMYASKTGPSRMKSGSAPGWSIAHKTGTGQNLGGTVAGYNDVGLVTSPDGSTYAVAILIGRTDVGIPERQRLMANVTRAVVDYERRKSGGGFGSR